MRNHNKPHVVTPKRLAELRAEALKTPAERAAEFSAVLAAAKARDPKDAIASANEGYRKSMEKKRQGRAVHTLKRIGTLGIAGTYSQAQDKKRAKEEAARAKIQAAERAALEADPEYLAKVTPRREDDKNREAAEQLLSRSSPHGSNLRRAKLLRGDAKAAEAAGDFKAADKYNGFAAEAQETALLHMQGTVDNAGERDYGLGSPYQPRTAGQTMAGLHSIARDMNEQFDQDRQHVPPHDDQNQ